MNETVQVSKVKLWQMFGSVRKDKTIIKQKLKRVQRDHYIYSMGRWFCESKNLRLSVNGSYRRCEGVGEGVVRSKIKYKAKLIFGF